MKWLDKLERKYGKYAIKDLMKYIIGLNIFVFILRSVGTSEDFILKLMLIPPMVMRGEIWRLITFAFIPPHTSPIWIIFALYLYYLIGVGLEREWGSFRFNLYYLMGMMATAVGAFITGTPATNTYLNLSLFLAFARIYPDFELMIFFILPVKVRYLAWFSWASIIFGVLMTPYPSNLIGIFAIFNYFIFFGKDIIMGVSNRRQVHNNRRKFREQLPRNYTMHKCTICGITEKDDPKMDFRYCVDCEGDYEYCMEHLKNHEHIKQ